MPHRCLSCSRIHADDAPEVLRGCACGKSAFLFVRSDAPEVAPGVTSPREGAYSVDVVRLLSTEPSAPTTDAVVIGEKDGTYEIDVRAALGVDGPKD